MNKAEEKIWQALGSVMDPEIPVISVVDLGVIVEVQADDNLESANILMTPTFSGCPAIQYMEKEVEDKIKSLGFTLVTVKTNFDVAWSSNRITDKGRKALKDYGLAPPKHVAHSMEPDLLERVECPSCNGTNTRMDTPFGPTLCRAIHYCNDCLEAFQQFKPV